MCFFVGNFVESFRFWAILDPRAFLRMTNKEEELWGTLEQVRLSPSDWFQQKTIKLFLTGPFKFARERVDVRRVWRVSGFFLRKVEVDTPGRARPTLDFSDSKTTFARLIRQNNWIPQFSNKIHQLLIEN